jgi:hypothetical protein
MLIELNLAKPLESTSGNSDLKLQTRLGDTGSSNIRPEGHEELVKAEQARTKKRLRKMTLDLAVDDAQLDEETKKQEKELDKLRQVNFSFGTKSKKPSKGVKPKAPEKDEEEEPEEEPDEGESDAGDEEDQADDEEAEGDE